jgi:acetoin utilization deacetylase AcuC-like enzyme
MAFILTSSPCFVVSDLIYWRMDSSEKVGREGVVLLYHPAFLEHDTGSHPESAARLRGILAALGERGIGESDLVRPEGVDLGLLAEVHDPRYVEAVEMAARAGGGYWDYDTYISPGSYEAAVRAAGAGTAAVDAVMEGARSAFALVRPPGHHALRASAMGFCLFNNVAVAAQHAVKKYGLERVMIVDWDVHHGNGTQDYFYDRDDVLFFSSHRYPFYPGTGALEEMGSGKGEGYTVNVPLAAGVGDEGYGKVFAEVVVPLARRYRPQLILVSAGYDSHLADPLGGMGVSVAGFAEMARTVRGLADEIEECEGRVAAILEGGYNVQALAASVVATIGMLGFTDERRTTDDEGDHASGAVYGGRREPDVSRVVERVRGAHRLEN